MHPAESPGVLKTQGESPKKDSQNHVTKRACQGSCCFCHTGSCFSNLEDIITAPIARGTPPPQR